MTKIHNALSGLGEVIQFLLQVLSTTRKSFRRREEIFQQVLLVIWQSAATTTFAGFFVGAIMSMQFTLQVEVFNALPYLGGLVTSGTIREVGPLLIAFLLSGKIGAYTAAELGTMKVTEQIDAIRCLGADPIQEIIVPRFNGIIIASFFMLTLGLLMSFFGGILVAGIFSDIPWEQYIKHIPTVMTFHSAISGLVKCFSFSLVIALVCTYRGYTVYGGAREVGEGVVRGATQTMIALVVMDWATSYLMEALLDVW